MRAIRTITISILALGLLAGSAVGVAAQSALVTGTTTSIDDCGDEHRSGAVCHDRWEFDDARLTGESESTLTVLTGAGGGKDLVFADIITQEGRLSNDGGAWTYTYSHPVFEPEQGWVPAGYPLDELPAQYQGWIDSGSHILLTGEGGYEGLMAYLTDGPRGYWGVILEPEPME